jgi:hypothetical protein
MAFGIDRPGLSQGEHGTQEHPQSGRVSEVKICNTSGGRLGMNSLLEKHKTVAESYQMNVLEMAMSPRCIIV